MNRFIKRTLHIAVLGVVLSASSLYAKSTVGGIIFTNVYYSHLDSDKLANNITKLNVIVPTNSRLRMRWDNEDRVGMYIEAGFGSGTQLTIRHAYGKWDLNEQWQILAGHTSTPFAPLNPQVSMVHNSGDGFGNPNPSRQSQVRFTYKFLNRQGAVALAILDPNTGVSYDNNVTGDVILKESRTARFDLGAVYKTFNMQLFPSAFYTQTQYEDVFAKNLDIWGVCLGLRTALGRFTFASEVSTGQNWGNTKMSDVNNVNGESRTAAIRVGDKLINNNVTKGWVDIGYRFAGDTLKGELHVVAGYDKAKSADNSVKQEYVNKMYGVSMPIDMPWIGRGFRLRPELFRYVELDKINADTDRTETIVGVQVQVTF